VKMVSVGVDVGGTNIVAGKVNRGSIVKISTRKTEASKGKKAVFNNLVGAIRDVLDKSVTEIGIGHPGPLDIKRGVIGNAVNLPMKGMALREMIHKEFSLPTKLDNDANCFALGEAMYGKGKGKSTVLGMTLGTGVGSGLVLNGKIFHGRSNALELGHTSIDFNGRKARCGNTGCLERYASTVGLRESAKEYGFKITDGEQIAGMARKGNPIAKKIWKEFGMFLGVGLANFANTFDPDIIIIGGNITRSWDLFSKQAISEMKKRALFTPCPVVKSTLKNAAVVGAAAL